MERSTCPECGEVIGGANHHLDPSNQVSSEFVEVARRLRPGIQPSSWANPY